MVQGSGVEMNSELDFYRLEFTRICRGQDLIDLDDILNWQEIKDLIQDGAISEEQVKRMYEGMPLESLLGGTATGMKVDTFVAFNGMLDIMLDCNEPSGVNKEKVSAPMALVDDEARPMPKQSELSFASMGSKNRQDVDLMGQEAEGNTGLSQEELAQMEILDQADNMLNSGGFGDFDLLIGDVSDPRLDALRVKQDTTEVRGDVKDIAQELLQMSLKQSRCGLDTDNELYESDLAYIRDRIEAIVERAPRPATKDITGSYSLFTIA